MATVNRNEIDLVSAELEAGESLTFSHIGRVFGPDFWMLLVEGFMDAQDAARAIQGAVNRLRGSEGVDVEEEDFDE